MHFSTASMAIAAAAFSTVASAVHINQYVNLSQGVTWATLVNNDGSSHKFGWFFNGCEKGPDYLRELCIDHIKERAHLVYSDGRKLCFFATVKNPGTNCGPAKCDHFESRQYTEVPCTW